MLAMGKDGVYGDGDDVIWVVAEVVFVCGNEREVVGAVLSVLGVVLTILDDIAEDGVVILIVLL